MNRAKLLWRMNELDRQTVEEALNIIALEVGASGLGRVKALNGIYTQPSWFFDRNAPFDGDRDAQLVLWHHHMGNHPDGFQRKTGCGRRQLPGSWPKQPIHCRQFGFHNLRQRQPDFDDYRSGIALGRPFKFTAKERR
jgi:hypothetical protein